MARRPFLREFKQIHHCSTVSRSWAEGACTLSPRRVCGTSTGGRYLVRAVSTTADGIFPANAPGYLYADATTLFATGVPQLQVSANIALAHVYTLDAASGCNLVDLTLASPAIRAAPSSVNNGGSVTVESTDALATSNFAPWKCSSDPTGSLTCTILELATSSQRTLTSFPYSNNITPAAGVVGCNFRYYTGRRLTCSFRFRCISAVSLGPALRLMPTALPDPVSPSPLFPLPKHVIFSASLPTFALNFLFHIRAVFHLPLSFQLQ